jgi:rhodanese-related sulfurtransferase
MSVGHEAVEPAARREGGPMPRRIDRQGVQRLLAEEEAQLVEVLPEAEFADEHLPRAINIPLKDLHGERVQRLDRARPVVVYCHDYQ